jgi:transcription-repair coupling factor (superfamily II helicase)
MRDLEIRGAGNLLGGEQSGFIADMGFELYQKILDEAVQELRHEEFSEVFHDKALPISLSSDELSVELDTDALLPETYIPKDTERFEFYKKLYNADNEFKLNEIVSELRDRYGALPNEAEELLFAVRLRMLTLPTGFVRITIRAKSMTIELPDDSAKKFYEIAFTPIASLVSTMGGARFIQKGKKGYIEIMYGSRDDAMNIMEQFARTVYEATHE